MAGNTLRRRMAQKVSMAQEIDPNLGSGFVKRIRFSEAIVSALLTRPSSAADLYNELAAGDPRDQLSVDYELENLGALGLLAHDQQTDTYTLRSPESE